MKKLLALVALCAVGAAYSADTTSTKKIDVKKQSFTERLKGYYYGALSRSYLSTEEYDAPNTGFVNYLNAGYKLTNDTSISTTFRFQLLDSRDENGKGDRFRELDQRVAISTKLYKGEKFNLSAGFTYELPTSRESQDDERYGRMKPSVSGTYTFDDYNSLFTFLGYNRTLRPEATASVDAYSRFYTTTWMIYTNKYLSEKYVLKIEYAHTMDQIAGSGDNALKKDDAGEELNIGVDADIAGVSVNPYIMHNPSRLKASNQLGAGLNIFKAF